MKSKSTNWLIDTNVLLRATRDPGKLGKGTVRILQEAPNVYFSAISIAEVELKTSNGKLPDSAGFYSELIATGFLELEFDAVAARNISRFGSLTNHDPFDRLLLAQAASKDLNFITSDRALLALGFDWVFDSAK